jgi:F-type H+-transporting ATPase subunit gamma
VRPVQRILLVAVSADKGLCGPFNANLIRAALQFLQEHREQQPQVIGVGRKVCHALRRQGWRLLAEYVDIFRRVEMAHARQLAGQIAEVYLAGQADAVYVVYNEFKSVLRQQIVVETLLPLSPEVVEAPRGRLPDYIYEDPPEVIFERLLPRYLDAEVFRVLLESAAGEQAARMTAMDAATSNAADLIDQLTLEMNKVRQASITKEIIEVVSGAAATGR